MKIVVTGAAGFVGRALAARLAGAPLALGQQLILVDRTPAATAPGARVVTGDLADPAILAEVAAAAPDLVFHLAAVPGGAAEADPHLSRRVNLDATLALVEAMAGSGRPPRFVYASTIAVFGAPLPPVVDDDTPARPAMTYGTHKLMVETALADAARRGALDAVALRIPGVVARPAGSVTLKSAFMSDLFHSLRDRRPITLPVGRAGRVWLISLERCIDNLVAAGVADLAPAAGRVALTMPALHVTIGDLVAAVAAFTGADPQLVDHAPEPALEAQFAAYPPLVTSLAARLGLRDDGDLPALVARACAALDGSSPVAMVPHPPK